MRSNEIGSEFWQDRALTEACPPCQPEYGPNRAFLLSGRTALEYIIRDVLRERPLRRVLLPSYCCDSMIEPFLRHGAEVSFYPVTAGGMSYDRENDAELVLVMNYFGYASQAAVDVAACARQDGKLVLYDATHMLRPDEALVRLADYCFCSVRKWLYGNFAWAEKGRSPFGVPAPTGEHEAYLTLRARASALKADYINYGRGEKQRFLSLYGEAEEALERDYADHRGQPFPVIIDALALPRRANAKVLIDGLRDVSEVRLWCDHVAPQDIPMFVPILLRSREERDALRGHLIRREIYCPVHWPLSELHTMDERDQDIYAKELSLVCDQRYREADMRRIVREIKTFLNEASV